MNWTTVGALAVCVALVGGGYLLGNAKGYQDGFHTGFNKGAYEYIKKCDQILTDIEKMLK